MLDPAGTANWSVENLAPGQHTVAASYGGDANDAAGNAAPVVFRIGETSINPAQVSLDSVLNAASYTASPMASDGYSVAFGSGFATDTIAADAASVLPVTMGGVTITVKDSQGAQAQAGLVFVSQSQINYVAPEGLAVGPGSITVTNGAGLADTIPATIGTVAPALFTADATGKGAAAALSLVFEGDNPPRVSPAFTCAGTPAACSAVPIDLAVPGSQVYLSLYGTGIRGLSGLSAIRASIGNIPVDVTYAGPQGTFAGLDQVNLLLPSSLAGKGETTLQLTVNDIAASPVLVNIR